MPSTKICSRCKRELPATSEYFNKNGGKRANADRLRNPCRECRADVRKLRKSERLATTRTQQDEEEKADLRKEAQPKIEVSPSSRSEINQRAILRLITKHRSEFEFYVFQEENNERLRARREKYQSKKRWVSLGLALTEEEDRDVLPEFALAQ